VIGRLKGMAASRGVLLAGALVLSGCGAVQTGMFTDRGFWENNGPNRAENELAELGLGELAKGNFGQAEAQFLKALDRNNRDVEAMYGLGLIYQKTGQATKARAQYEAILAQSPPADRQVVVWPELTTHPIAEVASVQLGLLDALAPQMTTAAPGAAGAGQAMAAQPGTLPPVRAFPNGTPGMVAQPVTVPSSALAAGRMAPAVASAPTEPDIRTPQAELNVEQRFEALNLLRDQGLITPDEFRARRQSNVGALLPLTAPSPAAGLDRSVPTPDQIAGRLRAIGRALEMRAMTIEQHASERSMILDALMPAAPINVANPGPSPKGLLEAADAVRRLERLREDGLISSDEYARERRAVETALQPPAAVLPAAQQVAGAPVAGVTPAAVAGQAAIHLASFKTEQDANRAWTQIRRAHAQVLGDLKADVARVDLGAKGIFFRLKAGPVASEAAATELCRQLKSRRQFCEPATAGPG